MIYISAVASFRVLLLNVWPAPSASGLVEELISLHQRIRPRSTLPATKEIRALWFS